MGTWNVGRPPKASRSMGGRTLGASSRRLGLDWRPLAVTAITIRNRSIGLAISMPGCRRNRTSGEKLTLKIRPNRSCALQCAVPRGYPRISKRLQPTRSWRTIQFFMKSSTRDKVEGAFKEVKGKVKEETGKATRNPDLRDRGTAEKTGGKVQRKIGDVKKVFEQ